jgi:hypothetical protein
MRALYLKPEASGPRIDNLIQLAKRAKVPIQQNYDFPWQEEVSALIAPFVFTPFKEFLEEARTKPLYDILFACEFPDEARVDFDGYRRLVLSDHINFVDNYEDFINSNNEEIKLGCDIGGGGDLSVFVARKGNVAWVASTLHTKDTMANVTEVERLATELKIEWQNINLDDIGIGRGATDRLKEMYAVNGVGFGDTASDSNTFANLKAELFWKLKIWCEAGGKLENNDGFNQIGWIRYKQMSGDKKIVCEPKEKLKTRYNGKSPDYADALALTFFEQPFIGFF